MTQLQRLGLSMMILGLTVIQYTTFTEEPISFISFILTVIIGTYVFIDKDKE